MFNNNNSRQRGAPKYHYVYFFSFTVFNMLENCCYCEMNEWLMLFELATLLLGAWNMNFQEEKCNNFESHTLKKRREITMSGKLMQYSME